MVYAMNAEEDGSVVGYMCMTDFECELGAASGGNVIFPSVEDLKSRLRCWEGCGIVKVKIEYVETILPSRLDEDAEDDLTVTQ